MQEFKIRVLKLVQEIPYGYITTYKIIANKLGTKAFRQVGFALSKNDNPNIIPCYKVIKSNGDIGGYSGNGGIKEKILRLKKDGIIIRKNKILNLDKHLYKFDKNTLKI